MRTSVRRAAGRHVLVGVRVPSPGRVSLYLAAAVGLGLFMGPFLWTILSSLKDPSEIMTFPPTFFPSVPRWHNYVDAWTRVPFGLWYRNTIIVVVLATIGEVLSTTLVAYGFARFRFRFRDGLFLVVLSTLMIPPEVTMVPSFLLFKWIGWLDTLKPLIVPQWFGISGFYVFLMRQFFLTIPIDFDEAAQLDGAGTFQILWNVLVPLLKPAVATVAIFSFLNNWNEFFSPLIYLNSTENFTLSLGLRYFQKIPSSDGEPMEHLLMAGTIIMTVPCIIVFFVAQRYFQQGIVMSGIKG